MVNKTTIFTLKQTKSGHVTCEANIDDKSILLHSSYDPMKEAQRFIEKQLERIKDKQRIIIYGLGCGHHVAEFLRTTQGDHIKIEVWDFNVGFYEFIQQEKFIKDIVNDCRVTLHVSDKREYILGIWRNFNPETDFLILHPASLKIIPENLRDMQEIFEIFQLNIANMLLAKDKLEEHFSVNITHAKIDRHNLLNGLLANIPMILVAAGPSLQQNIALLRKYREQVFIGCVGTALAPLIKEGIYPDFFMLTDMDESLITHFAHIDRKIQELIPLFYLSTVAPSVISLYPGPKIMLLQVGMEEAEQIAKDLNTVAVKTGGSVATTLLDWMVCLGAKQICFVGQDLAYTNHETHIAGAPMYAKIIDKDLQLLIEIDDYFLTGKVYTPWTLYIYKKWIESYIWQHKDVTFFNATQGGAHINNCHHITFEEFIKKISFNGDIKKYRSKFLEIIREIVADKACFGEG